MSVEAQSWYNPSANEEVLWYSHPSFVLRLPRILLGVGIALASLCAAVYGHLFATWPIEVIYSLLAIVPGGTGYTIYELLVFKNTWYVITNRRVIHKTNIIGQDKTSKPHNQIVHFDTNVSILDAILSYVTPEDIGDLVVRTSDDRGDLFVLRTTPTVGLAEGHLKRLTGDTSSRSPAHPSNEAGRNDHRTRRDTPSANTEPQNPEESTQQYQQPPHSDEKTPAEPEDDESDDGLDEFEPSEYA